jgi:hypothetical protein
MPAGLPFYARTLVRRRGALRMQAYENLAGNSGVEAYEILREGIRVRFNGGATYLYDYRIPGRVHVDEMKRLALAGRGLSTYIARFGGAYARRLD